jgi:hypothetical protein
MNDGRKCYNEEQVRSVVEKNRKNRQAERIQRRAKQEAIELVRSVMLLGRQYGLETEAELFLKHRMGGVKEFEAICKSRREHRERINAVFGSKERY